MKEPDWMPRGPAKGRCTGPLRDSPGSRKLSLCARAIMLGLPALESPGLRYCALPHQPGTLTAGRTKGSSKAPTWGVLVDAGSAVICAQSVRIQPGSALAACGVSLWRCTALTCWCEFTGISGHRGQ